MESIQASNVFKGASAQPSVGAEVLRVCLDSMQSPALLCALLKDNPRAAQTPVRLVGKDQVLTPLMLVLSVSNPQVRGSSSVRIYLPETYVWLCVDVPAVVCVHIITKWTCIHYHRPRFVCIRCVRVDPFACSS
jgi:hypothetical protein